MWRVVWPWSASPKASLCVAAGPGAGSSRPEAPPEEPNDAHTLCGDVYTVICEYLDSHSMANLELTSRYFREIFEERGTVLWRARTLKHPDQPLDPAQPSKQALLAP